jgi:hypothetical protein
MEVASARSSDELNPPATPVRLLSILVVVGVLVGVAGLVVPRFAGASEGEADRRAVVTRANDFAVTYNTYEVAKKDDYQKRMRDLLTPAYFKQFKTVTDALFDAIKSRGQRSGAARVLGVAIETIDEDSAVALVAVDASIKTRRSEAAVPRRFRWKVTFANQKGEWRVSQFETVDTLEASIGEPGASPSPDQSDSGGGNQ